ncbi:MAG: hypothetical protein GX158_08955 [Bacteroidales bacterium]|jgi:hypothetical protein|nr:hypothetical protein [Bacteroidales bacterium]
MNSTTENGKVKARKYKLYPTFGDSYGTGWNVMLDNFLRLLLVVFVLGILTGPMKGMNFWSDGGNLKHLHPHWDGSWEQLFGIASVGAFAFFLMLIALAYTFLALPVVRYGSRMIFVESVRKSKPDFEWLIRGFRTNYLNIILANLLVFALVMIAFFALIIPGIIVACRLVFVPYIVMDKKLDPIESVELSWKITRGHGWTIFLMGFVAFFIYILGMLLFIVGILPASIWVKSSFASMYQSVLAVHEKADSGPQ